MGRGVALGCAVLLASAACASSAGSPDGGGGSSADGGTPGAGDGGGAGGGSDAGGAGDAGLVGAGSIQVYSAPGTSSFVAAFARADPGETGLAGCTITPVGACKVTACPSIDGGSTADAGARDAGAPVHAGSMTLSGGLVAAPGLTVDPDAKGTYSASVQTPLWSGGEVLAVTATGAAVPAFTVQATAPPAGLSLTAPPLPATTGLAVPRATDLRIAWQIGATPPAGSVQVLLGEGTSRKSISCSFDVAAGSGVVPAAALGQVGAGPGSLTFAVASSTLTRAGGYAIELTLVNPARANGVDVGFTAVTFQ